VYGDDSLTRIRLARMELLRLSVQSGLLGMFLEGMSASLQGKKRGESVRTDADAPWNPSVLFAKRVHHCVVKDSKLL
jgi:hypothetical protein